MTHTKLIWLEAEIPGLGDLSNLNRVAGFFDPISLPLGLFSYTSRSPPDNSSLDFLYPIQKGWVSKTAAPQSLSG